MGLRPCHKDLNLSSCSCSLVNARTERELEAVPVTGVIALRERHNVCLVRIVHMATALNKGDDMEHAEMSAFWQGDSHI